jgi:hypothetical protein
MGIDSSYTVGRSGVYALFAIATGLVGYATGGGTLPPSLQNGGDMLTIYYGTEDLS